MEREHEDYEDEAQINEEMRKKLPLVFLIALAVVGLTIGGVAGAVYFFPGKKAEEKSFPISIKPRSGDCGDMVDAAAEVEKFDHAYPGRKKSMEVKKRDSAFSKCVVSVIIYYDGEPILVKPAPARPATLGGEPKNAQRI